MSNLPLKWFLASQTIWLGAINMGDRESLEAILANTFGSVHWLWDDADMIRFHQTSKELVLLSLKLPLEFVVVEQEVIKFPLILNESLFPVDKVDFRLASTDIAYYYSLSDILLLTYSNKGFNEQPLFNGVQLTTNLIVLLDDNYCISGWLILKASQQLTVVNEVTSTNNYNKIASNYLGNLLQLCNKNAYESMEEEDIKLKEKLLSLKQKVLASSSSNQHTAILKTIEGLLEGYY